MAKTNKATMDALADLHAAVARVLAAQLEYTEEQTEINEDGELVPTGKQRYTASPATVAAAIKFLKDNNVSAEEEQEENLSRIREALARKRKHSAMRGAEAAKVVDLHNE